MAITHKEADTMIIQQVSSIGADHDQVIDDDTDICVLICHCVCKGDITGHVMMISPVRGRTLIDINVTVEK